MPELSRRLGTVDAVVIGLGSMMGAGVFAAFGPAATSEICFTGRPIHSRSVRLSGALSVVILSAAKDLLLQLRTDR